MSIFKRIKEAFITPQGLTYTPYEPMNTLIRIEIAIMKHKHTKLEEYLKATPERQTRLNAYLDGLQDAYDMVRAESQRIENQNTSTK